jgi:serine/threonine protein kinase
MDREAKDFLVKFTAYNGAREETEGKLDIGKLEDLEGRGQYPPIPVESLKFVSDSTGGSYDKTLQWEHPKACSKIKSVILEYRDHQGSMKELNEHGKIRKITELKPGTEYTVNLYVEYATGNTPRRSEAVSISFNTTCNCDGCCMEVITPLLSVGAIIGIVCGGLVLLLVIAIVIVVIVRKSRHQPAVPPTIQHAGHNVRKRVSTWFGAGHGADNWDVPPPYDHNNPEAGTIENLAFSPAEAMQASGIAYAEMSEDDDMYIYGDMKTDEKARWKFSNDRIEFGKAIPNAKGNFAVIRFATLMTKKGKETIVAKSLKAHHTDDDERLMRAKMNFMGTKLRLHANIVNFIGALPEADGGPVMLLEYCDEGRLSDWLKKHQHIDGDVEENLSNFSMMIANGLMFLHENDILHKRLGIRNIYLKNKNGSLHAKLAGFGPMRGEAEGSEAKEKIPIKWMAPEQMDKVPGQKRIYSKETDVWSYGIVLWELYSKGEQPYPNIKAKDLKEQVKSGYRMPKPNDCPDHLYTEIIQECWYEKPGVRPPIEQIYMSLREYYDSAGRQSTYYDEDDLMEEEDLYYADGFSTMSYDKTNKDFYE